jgi:hypothetical protein
VDGAGAVPADAVVVALGPWSGQATAWLPLLPAVGGQKAHSVVLRPRAAAADAAPAAAAAGGGGGGGAEAPAGPGPEGAAVRGAAAVAAAPSSAAAPAAVDATALFVRYRDAAGRVREPELYPRPDGTVYVSAPPLGGKALILAAAAPPRAAHAAEPRLGLPLASAS